MGPPEEAQYNFVAEQLAAVCKKCERQGVSPEVVVRTVLSFGITMAIAFEHQEDVAKLLESLAAAVRCGDIKYTEH